MKKDNKTFDKKILVVDDEEGIRFLLENNLYRYGFTVISAANGRHGLQKLQSTPDINLVICDLKMAGMDGFEFFQNCQRDYPHLPFIVMTGVPDRKKLIQMAQNGLSHVLIKPFKIEELLERIEAVTQQKAKAS
jgi:DNA-binding NtrC family response regulator